MDLLEKQQINESIRVAQANLLVFYLAAFQYSYYEFFSPCFLRATELSIILSNKLF